MAKKNKKPDENSDDMIIGEFAPSEKLDNGMVTPEINTKKSIDKFMKNVEVEEEKLESIVLSGPESPDEEDEVPKEIPDKTDKGWSQYVMSQFADDELDGLSPRLEGLRRVAELLLGCVIEERSELISSPTMENGERACAKCTLIFSSGKIFEALADAYPGNCTKDFTIYPVAMADTRAKGRAYRAALGLKRVVAAEEIGIVSGDEENINQSISVGQQTAIMLLSDRLGVSIKKLLEDNEIICVLNNGFPDLKSITYSEALVVLNRLNNIRQEGHIPEKLKK